MVYDTQWKCDINKNVLKIILPMKEHDKKANYVDISFLLYTYIYIYIYIVSYTLCKRNSSMLNLYSILHLTAIEMQYLIAIEMNKRKIKELSVLRLDLNFLSKRCVCIYLYQQPYTKSQLPREIFDHPSGVF